MLTITLILLVGALVGSILCLMGKCPAGVPCLLLSIVGLLGHLPLG